ncbi:hypothetical protein [Nostoc sp.]|uniref:hypothetical protein n=1 Tax=Nostoc sp. TaxID=1180 RepID=UPI002FF63E6C
MPTYLYRFFVKLHQISFASSFLPLCPLRSLRFVAHIPGFLTTPLKARACAGEQGSRGAGESSMCQVQSPLPLCPSALSNA